MFQFPNGANRSQIGGLVSEYLRHLIDTSWEQGRNDAILTRLCDSLKKLSEGTDTRFQAYPFHSPKKIRQFSVELPRDSTIAIFRHLLNFLMRYPNVQGFLIPKEVERCKGRLLAPEQESRIDVAVKDALSQLGGNA